MVYNIFEAKECFINNNLNILATSIEYLKTVGPVKADLLKKELQVYTFGDLLNHYPFRYVDKRKIDAIRTITPMQDYVQVAGNIISIELFGAGRQKRLVATIRDATGELELVWFQSITAIEKLLAIGAPFIVFGKPSFFNSIPQIVHPEMEAWTPEKKDGKAFLEPVYPSTEKLKLRGLGGRQLGKLTQLLLEQLLPAAIPEIIPQYILQQYHLPERYLAYRYIHFPSSEEQIGSAVKRFKFEELFLAQVRMNLVRVQRRRQSKGVIFSRVGELFNRFYKEKLPFELTNAQKRVIKEIRADMAAGKQMNRLLQGDVGSGKTMVALLVMLLANDNHYQACLMAPTEILARQHFESITKLVEGLPVQVALLTGSVKKAQRKELLHNLETGLVQMLIGTHAVIEDTVQFKQLGIVIIDEQHRFGVAQRAKLWKKAVVPPHVLVMTATPIPRTLAMSAYGDLDYSVIDELPPGRQPITTVHRYENKRSLVMDFLKAEIALGRQVYVIFPLIEESDKVDYENLMQGYEDIKRYFPEPRYWISMVHGRQPSDIKETNMQRFVNGDTQIMVSTTVIEVGVNVPNASVMVIESAEKFGLSQLHQLRGRVGRGSEKSYCILMTSVKLSNDGKERIKIMTETNNGFEIAEKDLALRGPGEIEGTRQSGTLNFKLADIVNDKELLYLVRETVETLLEEDSSLVLEKNYCLQLFLRSQKQQAGWAKIS